MDNATAYYPKVSGLEQLPALILTALIVILGVQPSWLVRWSEASAVLIGDRVPVVAIADQPLKSLTYEKISLAFTKDVK